MDVARITASVGMERSAQSLAFERDRDYRATEFSNETQGMRLRQFQKAPFRKLTI